MMTIYALIDPRSGNYFYVGRTSDFPKRLTKHNSPQTNVGTFKNEYIRELKALGLKFEYEILEVVPKSEGRFWEEYYTDLFRTWGFDLMNNRYYKMGNQTSFQPGQNYKPVVAVTKSGELHSSYDSIKQAANTVGKKPFSINQSLARRKKSIAGLVWFYRDQYETISKEEFERILTWANTCDLKANSGSFKKGQVSHNKIEISDELAAKILSEYIPRQVTQKQLSVKYGLGKGIIYKVIKNANDGKL